MTALVTKHLPLVAGAPDGIRRIRQLIIDLGVSGNLISEVSTDEWQQVRLSDLVTSFQNGVSSRGAVDGQPVTVLRLADIKSGEICLDDPRMLMLDAETIEKYMLVDGDMLVIRVNGSADLVGRFIVHGDSGGALHCDHFIRLRLDRERIEPRFLKLIGDCSSTRASIQGLFVSTAGQKTVNQGHVGSLSVQLPPLAEQHRIVAKVDELMALCDRLEADQADAQAAHAQLVKVLLDSLTQATDATDFRVSWQRLSEHFHTLFTTEASIDALKQTVLQLAVMGRLVEQKVGDGSGSELLELLSKEKNLIGVPRRTRARVEGEHTDVVAPPYALPPNWLWTRLGAVASDVQYGFTASANPLAQGHRLLRITDIQNEVVNWAQVPGCDISAEDAWAYELKDGDILIARTGGTVGKSYLVRDLQVPAVFASYLIRVGCLPSANPRYTKVFLGSSLYWQQLNASAMGTGQPNVNGTALKNLMIPLPPLAEQHRIVAKVDELIALCDQLKAQLTEARQQHAQLATALVEQAVA